MASARIGFDSHEPKFDDFLSLGTLMIRVNLDNQLESQLSGLDDAQLCDASGKPMGHFLSEVRYRRLVYEWANAQISDEELQRRLQTPGGKMLSEIWSGLEGK